jgi:hypothetical protein
MRWEQGRQGTGYRKLLLRRGSNWDLWVLDYPVGTSIPRHTDPLPNKKRHFRANIRLLGEEDLFEGESLFRLGRLVVFRPDIMPHAVSQVRRRRVLLSFGIAL